MLDIVGLRPSPFIGLGWVWHLSPRELCGEERGERAPLLGPRKICYGCGNGREAALIGPLREGKFLYLGNFYDEFERYVKTKAHKGAVGEPERVL
jgi:hypothetical protein